ncbi:MAG: 50S ribosomal protein L32 [Phycisphaeraceae bacterium]|nr:50S ribosomal protein L32 [Phycisphaeraceae bacterium]
MLPVQRKTRTQSRKGRSHQAMRRPAAVHCPNCGTAKFPHSACPECGYVRPGLKLKLSKDE